MLLIYFIGMLPVLFFVCIISSQQTCHGLSVQKCHAGKKGEQIIFFALIWDFLFCSCIFQKVSEIDAWAISIPYEFGCVTQPCSPLSVTQKSVEWMSANCESCVDNNLHLQWRIRDFRWGGGVEARGAVWRESNFRTYYLGIALLCVLGGVFLNVYIPIFACWFMEVNSHVCVLWLVWS